MTFATQLRRWRNSRSQSGAAKILGVPLATYRNWEQERNKPSKLARQSLLSIMRGKSVLLTTMEVEKPR